MTKTASKIRFSETLPAGGDLEGPLQDLSYPTKELQGQAAQTVGKSETASRTGTLEVFFPKRTKFGPLK